jgi:hypothetical protein
MAVSSTAGISVPWTTVLAGSASLVARTELLSLMPKPPGAATDSIAGAPSGARAEFGPAETVVTGLELPSNTRTGELAGGIAGCIIAVGAGEAPGIAPGCAPAGIVAGGAATNLPGTGAAIGSPAWPWVGVATAVPGVAGE